MSEKPTVLGRPTKFNESLREKIIELAKAGKTHQQIADIIGVHVRTIENWRGKHPELLWAINEAKQIADELVEASLFARAAGYSHPEVKVFCQDGQIIEHVVEKHYPPDVTAQIFWLKNRQPELWREKQPGETPDVNVTVNVSKVDLLERVEQLKATKPEGE